LLILPSQATAKEAVPGGGKSEVAAPSSATGGSQASSAGQSRSLGAGGASTSDVTDKKDLFHLARARVYASDDRFETALQELEKALEINPNNADALAYMALLEGRLGKYLASVGHVKQAIKLEPQVASHYSVLGRGLAAVGDAGGAVAALSKSLSLDPKNPNTYVNLAAVRGQQGDYKEAVFLYSKALELNPRYTEAYLGLSTAYGKLGDSTKQLEAAAKAVSTAPRSARAHARLGYVHSVQGDASGAMSEGLKSNILRIQDSWNDFLGMFLTAWACVFLFFALIFAIIFAGAKFKPQDGEKVIGSFFLTFYKDRPGRFVVTNSRLVFVPEAFSSWFGATRVSIQRSQVEALTDLSTVGGGTLSILTKDKSVHQFRMPTLVLDPLKSLLQTEGFNGLGAPVDATTAKDSRADSDSSSNAEPTDRDTITNVVADFRNTIPPKSDKSDDSTLTEPKEAPPVDEKVENT
jgi:Flp pilus assembly protein TadD